MISVTDIKGIGPAKAETLEEEGYESVEEIANAERDELASISGVGDDRALEYIVGANDLIEAEEEVEEETDEGDEFDLTPSELSDELDEEEAESQDDSEEDVEQEASESVESDESSLYDVSLSFEERLEYDVFHAALMRYHENIYTSYQPAADAMQKLLDGLNDFNSVSYELSEFELNTLHTSVKQCRNAYQGDNMIDHMDALVKVEKQIDEAREEYLL